MAIQDIIANWTVQKNQIRPQSSSLLMLWPKRKKSIPIPIQRRRRTKIKRDCHYCRNIFRNYLRRLFHKMRNKNETLHQDEATQEVPIRTKDNSVSVVYSNDLFLSPVDSKHRELVKLLDPIDTIKKFNLNRNEGNRLKSMIKELKQEVSLCGIPGQELSNASLNKSMLSEILQSYDVSRNRNKIHARSKYKYYMKNKDDIRKSRRSSFFSHGTTMSELPLSRPGSISQWFNRYSLLSKDGTKGRLSSWRIFSRRYSMPKILTTEESQPSDESESSIDISLAKSRKPSSTKSLNTKHDKSKSWRNFFS